MWSKLKENQPPEYLGKNRDWNIDLVPKFVMSNGKLVKMLLKTRVSKYLEWKCNNKYLYKWKAIDGTYVYQVKEGGVFSKGGP